MVDPENEHKNKSKDEYRIEYSNEFKKSFKKIKDSSTKKRIIKLIDKISLHPEIGKPMRYERRGTREVYLDSFRISDSIIENELIILFINIYHKDNQ